MSGRGRRRWPLAGLVGMGSVVLIYWIVGGASSVEQVAKESFESKVRRSVGARAATRPLELPAWFSQPGVLSRRVAGTVYGNGAPRAGAQVRIELARLESDALKSLTRTTDRFGRFDFGELPAAEYRVVATASQMAADSVFVDSRDPTAFPAAEEIELFLAPCDVNVTGRVTDVSGGPIAGAIVRSDRGSQAPTDDEGHYVLCLGLGSYVSLSIRAQGYARFHASAQSFADSRLDAKLSPEAVIVGTVVRRDTRERVAYAKVEVRAWRGGGSWVALVADANGAFRADGLAPGRYVVSATSDDARSVRDEPLLASVGAEESVTLLLSAATRVRGKVVDENDDGIAGVEIITSDYQRSATSQEDGSFELTGIRYGSLTLRTRPNPTGESHVATVVDADANVTIRMATLSSLSGRVTRNGEAAGAVQVYARSEELPGGSARTAADGSYRISLLAAGEYRVGASTSEAFAKAARVELATGEALDGIDIDLRLAATIGGTVVDQVEQPIAGAYVVFKLVDGQDWGFATTDASGSYLARAMSGGGDYEVTVHPKYNSARTLPPAVGPYPRTFLADGASRVEGVRLVAELERLTIRGAVRYGDGAPAADVVVEAEAPLPPTRERYVTADRYRTVTDSEGAFSFDDLMAGTYSVTAEAPFGGRDEKEAKAGGGPLSFTLGRSGRLRGTVEGFSGPTKVRACTDKYECGSTTARAGTFAFKKLAPGTYNVVASGAAESTSGTVEVRSGEESEISLSSPGSAVVEGSLRDVRSGAPIRGMHCTWTAVERKSFARAPSSVPVDAAGDFELSVPAKQKLGIRCTDDAYGKTSVDTVRVTLEPGSRRSVLLRVYEHKHRERTLESDKEAYAGLFVSGTAPPTTSQVVEGGPAEKAGLRAGDTFVEVDGLSVRELSGWLVVDILRDRPVGGSVAVTVERRGQPVTTELTVEARGRRRGQ